MKAFLKTYFIIRKGINIVFISFLFSCASNEPQLIIEQPFELPAFDESITLFFCGDVMQHKPQINSAYNPEEKDYFYKECFQHIAPYWTESDFVIANLETTLSDKNFSGYPFFSAPWQLAKDLHELGVTTFVTANNHCCDKMGKGIRNTIYYLDSLGITHTGIFADSTSYLEKHPLYLKKDNFKIALLNYTYGTNGLPIPEGCIVPHIDTTLIKKDIDRAKKDLATNIVVYLHWGEEYAKEPNRSQKELSEWLHKNHVDIIIGSHPHVVQPIKYNIVEKDTIGVTVFSLGNFISNQPFKGTDGGLCVKLTISHKADNRFDYNLQQLKVYTYRPYEDGKMKYYCIPENEIDKITHESHKTSANKFFNDASIVINKHHNISSIININNP